MKKVEVIGDKELMWSVELDNRTFRKWKRHSQAISHSGIVMPEDHCHIVSAVVSGLLLCSISVNIIQFVS